MEAARTLSLNEARRSSGRVEVLDGRVVAIEALEVEDATLAELVERRLGRGIEAIATIADALEIGARVLDREATGAEVDVVKREFAELQHGFADQARRITDDLDERLEQFLGEEGGEMAQRLDAHAQEVAEQLAEVFGEGRSSAVQNQIREILSKANAESRQELVRQFSSEEAHNPLADLKGDVRRQVESQRKSVEQLVEKLATMEVEIKRLHDAREAAADLAAERERGTSKGRDFEETVFGIIERMAIARGDVATHVGDESSESGGKKGDIVVEIDAAGGPGTSRIVLELKDQRLSKRAAWELLDACLVEREADFAILVVASEDKLPAGREPLHEYQGNKMITVLERDDLDERGLFLAYSHARLRCITASERALELDAAGVRDAADEAFTALKAAQGVRNSLTKAERGVSGARDGLDAMVKQVEIALAKVESLIKAAP